MSKKRKGGRASSKRQKAAERVRAERGLGSLVNRARQDDNYRNQLSSIASVIRDVSDKPQRFGKDNESRRDFILRNTDPKTGRMNSAAQAMLAFYDDGRSEYQRDLNRFITGSPVNREAYKQSGLKGAGLNLFATEFPEAFASRTGIGRIITAMDKGKDKVIEAGKKIAEVLN
ncbi:MAG TPA: hypothetical protein VLB82_13660, partial [Thermodesulfobacteriota bacterium]|nr:hypothetical protein [Thermodesulfobacteriota bacterium]